MPRLESLKTQYLGKEKLCKNNHADNFSSGGYRCALFQIDSIWLLTATELKVLLSAGHELEKFDVFTKARSSWLYKHF